jgi:hypothetical protein
LPFPECEGIEVKEEGEGQDKWGMTGNREE